jgi:hypothetical protein
VFSRPSERGFCTNNRANSIWTPSESMNPPFRLPNTPKDTSLRTSETSSWLNDADLVEWQMKRDRQRIWGFALYRCTYSSEPDWQEFLARLNACTEHLLDQNNGRDLLLSLNLSLHDDRDIFDGATAAFVRQHFEQWAAAAMASEGGEVACHSTRYNFCVRVSEEVLRSVVDSPLSVDDALVVEKAFVDIVWKDWEPYEAELPPGWLSPSEACLIMDDPGWARFSARWLMPTFYDLLSEGAGSWDGEQCRLPEVRMP